MLGDFGAAPEYVSSLSVGGIDGTLARRMDESDLRGAVRAKTGLLDGVTAISGILHTTSRGDMLFSMITNGFDGAPREMHRIEERVLTALAGI